MQIYSKSMKNALQICTSGGDVYYASRNLLSTCSYWPWYNSQVNIHVFLFMHFLLSLWLLRSPWYVWMVHLSQLTRLVCSRMFHIWHHIQLQKSLHCFSMLHHRVQQTFGRARFLCPWQCLSGTASSFPWPCPPAWPEGRWEHPLADPEQTPAWS